MGALFLLTIFLASLSTLSLLALALLYARFLKWKFDPVIPMPSTFGFLGGHLPEQEEMKKTLDVTGSFLKNTAKYGRFYTVPFPLGIGRLIIASDPEWIDYLLVKKNCPRVEIMNAGMAPFLGSHSLLTAPEEEWKTLRRQLSHAFSPASLREQYSVLEGATARFLTRVEASNSTIPDLDQWFVELAFEVIGLAAFGDLFVLRSKEILGLFRDSAIEAYAVLVDPIRRVLPIRASTRKMYRDIGSLRSIIRTLIHQKLKEEDVGTTKTIWKELSTLDLSEEVMIDNIVTFLFAGHDTTAHTMAYAIVELCRHPQVLAKLHSELDAIMGDAKFPTLAQIPRMDYLQQIIKEALRVHQPTNGPVRELDETVTINGLTIQKGEWLATVTTITHFDEKIFPEPLSFNPDRWTKEFEPNLPKGAYAPFSLGPKNCIGKEMALQEMAFVLATLSKAFDFGLPADFKFQKRMAFIVAPAAPITLSVKPRT